MLSRGSLPHRLPVGAFPSFAPAGGRLGAKGWIRMASKAATKIARNTLGRGAREFWKHALRIVREASRLAQAQQRMVRSYSEKQPLILGYRSYDQALLRLVVLFAKSPPSFPVNGKIYSTLLECPWPTSVASALRTIKDVRAAYEPLKPLRGNTSDPPGDEFLAKLQSRALNSKRMAEAAGALLSAIEKIGVDTGELLSEIEKEEHELV